MKPQAIKAAVLAACISIPVFAFAQFFNDIFPWNKPIPGMDLPMTPRVSPANGIPVLLTQITESWDEGTWIPIDSTTFFYDAAELLTKEFSQKPEGPNWNNNQRILYQYEGNSANEMCWQYWNGTEWTNFQLTSFEFDAYDKPVQGLTQSWDIVNSTWFNASQVLYEYDANSVNTSLLWQNWSGGIWRNSLLFTFAYDETGNILEMQVLNWNGLEWEKFQRNTYTYENDLRTAGLVEQWSKTALDWQLVGQFLYEYNEDNHNTSLLTQRKLESGWENWFRQLFFWENPNGIVSTGLPKVSIHAFPNPCNGRLTLELPPDGLSNGHVQLFNQAGQRVYLETIPPGTPVHMLDLSRLPAGAYFLQVSADGKAVAVEKVIRE